MLSGLVEWYRNSGDFGEEEEAGEVGVLSSFSADNFTSISSNSNKSDKKMVVAMRTREQES